MDFTPSPETEALRDLAASILVDRSTPERLTELDREEHWFDRRTFQQLADAGVVGIALPEEHGGAGLGFLDLHHALAEVGATVAQVPLWESAVLGGLPVARHGTAEQQAAWLPGVASGASLLTAALQEPGGADPRAPRTGAAETDGGWLLTGTRTQVPFAAQSDLVLVPASAPDGRVGLFLVPPDAEGVTLEPQQTVARRPSARLELDQVRVTADDLLGGAFDDGSVLDDVVLHAEAGLASLQSGVCAGALRMAATYTSGREQFGQPIAGFQAVRQRLADAYIDVEAMRLTSLQAAWRLTEGDRAAPETRDAVSVAKFWAADGGHRVLHTAQHVHGGMGIDLDYPLHRFYRMGKFVELTLGHATHQLRRIGRQLAHQAAEPAPGGLTR